MIPKIFQIGFNKCGTLSLFNLFERNNIKSLHWDNGNIAETILFNLKNSNKCLKGYEEYTFFSDLNTMQVCGSFSNQTELFKEYKIFDLQYPGSKFILNIRDMDDWIISRLNHYTELGTLVNVKKKYNITQAELCVLWKIDWMNHIVDVKKYFANRKEDLLIFDIGKDDPAIISDFFKGIYTIDPIHYIHSHKTINPIF